jgi:tetratricopeptide (TPR) repeat protein
MMSRFALLTSALLLIHCRSVPAQTRPDDGETERLRKQLAEAHVRILKLELEKSRLSGKPGEELRILVESGLASEFGEVRAAALVELAALPEERRRAAVPEVLRRFPSSPETYKVQAVAFLGRIPSPEAETAVLKAASDPLPAVRIAAASALKTSGREEAVPTLLALLRDPSRDVRIAAIDALGVSRRESAVRPLLEFLEAEKDDSLQEKTADALGTIGSPHAVDALLGLLRKTAKETIRWSCINSLGKIGDARAAETLRPFLEPAHSPTVREIAIEALGKMKDEASIENLLRILRADGEEKLRLKSAAALARVVHPGMTHTLILPIYAEEKSPEVRRTLWDTMKALVGEAFEPNESLILALLDRGFRTEAEEACTKLHSLKPEDPFRTRQIALEERMARAAMDAGDAKSALPHFRQAFLTAPDSADLRRKVIDCYRQMNDTDGAVKLLREAEPRLPRGEAGWWALKLDLLDALRAKEDAEGLVQETHGLLQMNPPALTEERKKKLEQTFREAAYRIVQPLADKEEGVRKNAQEAVRRLSRPLGSWLAAELEAAPSSGPPLLVETAALILGAPQDPAKPRETATALRAWLAQPPAPK